MIIGLVGKAGSGKGTVSAYLEKKYGAEKLRFSRVLDDILNRLYLEVSRSNEITLALGLREKFGRSVIARVLAQDFLKSEKKLGVLDGIRYWEEIETFKKLPDFILVYIDAPIELRYERNRTRGEKKDDDVTLEKFKEMEKAPTERYILEMKEKADILLDNSGQLDDLYRQIDDKLGLMIKS